jgi:hypothetical protein
MRLTTATKIIDTGRLAIYSRSDQVSFAKRWGFLYLKDIKSCGYLYGD